jgi:metallo-beta-lactamase class B
MIRALLAMFVAVSMAAPAVAQTPEERVAWNRPAAPFRVVDNIYSVGTEGIAVFLITDPKGHILLDGGLPESVPLIVENIRALGFRVEDIDYLLNSHAHLDHAGGLAALKRMTGASVVASAGDRPELEAGTISYRESIPFPAVPVDRTIVDGGQVKVGASVMTAHVTPGHTKGCTTWSTTVTHQGSPQRVIFSCSLTVAGQPLVNDRGYPEAVSDFKASFAKFRALPADIFLANHPVFFDMEAKRKRQLAGDANAFVNPADINAYVARFESEFAAELKRQQGAAR